MRLTRVYVDAALASGTRVTLRGSAAGHVSRVLRLRVGDALTLFNGRGGEYAATLAAAGGGSVTVAVAEHRALECESALQVRLAQGISRGERMDLVVQKATELGVTAIAPLFTERSVVRLDARQGERRLAHWRAVVVAACEQSGRNRVPEVAAPAALADFLRSAAAPQDAPDALRLLLSPGATLRLRELPRPAGPVTVLIGPEGGLTEVEMESARAAGFTPVRLGPRVLRTETAALAALALLQREFGDM